jgi:hypothetical protein
MGQRTSSGEAAVTQTVELHASKAAIGSVQPATVDVTVGDGEALLRIDLFALTANNVTYAAHGEDFRYWAFFPAPQGKGIVPVWGFATVVESRAPGIDVGQRFYGYWPMASHALLLPGKVSPRGFTDMAAHRLVLPPVYNNYVAASDAYGSEAVQALFRPLYTTSFVLDLMLTDSPVETLVLTSASSKTALGLAQLAKGRQKVIGLTSAANKGFAESTGYYDLVLDYADVAKLPAAVKGTAALVDFAGNGAVRHAVHSHLGAALAESHVVGDTHWEAENLAELPGPQPRMFFAPTVIVERIGQWGPDGFEQKLAAAWRGFIASTGWLNISTHNGPEAVAAAWAKLAAGRIDPAEGLIASV